MSWTSPIQQIIFKIFKSLYCLDSQQKCQKTCLDSVMRSYQELKYQILQKHVLGWIYENVKKKKKLEKKNINKIKIDQKSICFSLDAQMRWPSPIQQKWELGELKLYGNSHYVIIKRKKKKTHSLSHSLSLFKKSIKKHVSIISYFSWIYLRMIVKTFVL